MADRTKNQSPEKVEPEAEATTAPDVGFGSDDLGRIQGLLFGDHARKTSERIDTLESALLGVIADLRRELTDEVTALSDRINSESETRTKAVTNLSSRLDEASKGSASETKALRKDLDTSVEKLTESLDKAEAHAASQLEATRAELAGSLEQTDLDLRDTKVDRAALAELFNATAAKLTGD